MLYSELALLGYNMSLLGTKCMLEALKIMYYSDNLLLGKSIARNIYPVIAKKFDISVNVVKGNVNYATSRMLKNAKNRDAIRSIRSSSKSNKIGVKTVLHYIIKKVKYNN